ncbi:AlpA family phage regulatory protein [Paraburkholderia sp. JHI869]|uniref:helix-turn-helix transcriptional regulator n=1 Tax=Paraburkholderia sp. JHI869 TaxID=3112959 RepID=UPI0031754A09
MARKAVDANRTGETIATQPPSLLPEGYTRLAELLLIVPMSGEAIRQRELKGRFPKRVQLGSARCVAWKNSEILSWLADPAGYRAPQAA